ncbi:PREDICTED: uncharacterized protein LOC105362810 [Ceratosolen solmsi marchali]|uniref:Uncharacterized protein LOC105362810 n=1 Tax=Ceratosolen solmsi marchali TaxID=326594 RepID=A0AAJ6YIA5_9HYME|nr:PREDICTED: uncharacterized protein LOC105362810 [Ceratosolen solmsi marchali]
MTGKAVTKCCLVLLTIVAATDAFCYRKSVPKNQENAEVLGLTLVGNYSIWVCVQSPDIAADLERAPKINTTQIWFSMSKVEKLKSEAFAKFAEKLIKIEIWDSKLAEIEDGALKGLKELKGLVLPRNELTTVKAAWFKDTVNLLELNLMYNRIQSLEFEFLKLVPALINLDLRGNELIALPTDFIRQLPVSLRRLNIYSNPLNYRQMIEVMEWSKAKDDKTNDTKLKELKHVFNITKICLEDKTILDKNTEAINKCVEDKMNNEIAFISGNKTAVKV